MIVMIGMIAGSVGVEGMLAPLLPILDFDTIVALGTNIPSSFQPKWFIQGNGGAMPAGTYVYFTVIPNGGGAVGNVGFAPLNINIIPPGAVAVLPIAGETNIYFPEDAHQPTTPEAAAWSCANVNDSRITDWYVAMFGGPVTIGVVNVNQGNGVNNVNIKVGFGQQQGGGVQPNQSIISLGVSMVHVGCCPSCSYDYRDNFWEFFRQIANNPVGRILLYRLLIEIRRVINNVGADEFGNTQRNHLRSINIVNEGRFPSNYTYMFYPNTARINVNPGRTGRADMNNVKFNGQERYEAVSRLITGSTPYSVHLFHEMIHWFHALRYYGRYDTEIVAKRYRGEDRKSNFIDFYFGRELDLLHLNPAAPFNLWTGTGFVNDSEEIDLEEMRTILGINENITQGVNRRTYQSLCNSNNQQYGSYLNGDELSENLYRCALNEQLIHQNPQQHVYLRWGHGFFQFPQLSGKTFNVSGFFLSIEIALRVVVDIFQQITEAAPQAWGAVRGQAFE
ncbi:MAG: hypothetical protein LBG04_01655 [Holosporaceae bacterium]|nr:hypothetical protein [Holosporaceae bacterium]